MRARRQSDSDGRGPFFFAYRMTAVELADSGATDTLIRTPARCAANANSNHRDVPTYGFAGIWSPRYDARMNPAVIVTISDSRSAGQAEDKSGPLAAEQIAAMGIPIGESIVVPDDIESIRSAVSNAARTAPLVVTTGGTGVGPRDVTPEALQPIFDRDLPGFGEIMRTGSYAATPLSIISRGGAGVVGRCLVVMLPGSPGGVRDSLELLGPAIRHVLKVLSDAPADCEEARSSGD